MRRILLLAGGLALAGCTTAHVQMPDGTSAGFTRSFTAAAVDISQDPDGRFSLHYSSDPQAQMLGQLFSALNMMARIAASPAFAAAYANPRQLHADDF